MLLDILIVERIIVPTTKSISLVEVISGRRPNGERSSTFRCRARAHKAGCRSRKLSDHSIKGCFLGYCGTTKNVISSEEDENTIKIARSVAFDEMFSDLTILLPNA